MEKYEVEIVPDSWGLYDTYRTNLGIFVVMRNQKLDYYGNPRYTISPHGYVRHLPPIAGMRRNHNRQLYTVQSYNIEQTMEWFLEKLSEQLAMGHSLYHNN